MTPCIQNTLSFLRTYMAAHDGVCPTFDEIKDHLGIASKSGVHRLMNEMEQRGLITRLKGQARSIQINEGPSFEAMAHWSDAEIARVEADLRRIKLTRAGQRVAA